MSSPRKFRVWSNELKQWITHCVALAPDGVVLTHSVAVHDDGKIEHRVNLAEPLKPIVEQFTGIQDREGKDIYENDILSTPLTPHAYGIVTYRAGEEGCGFVVSCFKKTHSETLQSNYQLRSGDRIPMPQDRQVVIGNIHENPELLIAK